MAEFDAAASFHLNDDQQPLLERDDVDLASVTTPVSVDDLYAVCGEVLGGEFFAGNTKCDVLTHSASMEPLTSGQ